MVATLQEDTVRHVDGAQRADEAAINQLNQQVAHIEATRTDLRDEIKRRIEQRDTYSIALVAGLGGIVAIIFTNQALREALVVVPLFVIFYTTLLQYSYRVHNRIARFLRIEIEPLLAELCKTPKAAEWEMYYDNLGVVDIRGRFFLFVEAFTIMIVMGSLLLMETDPVLVGFLWLTTGVYVLAALSSVLYFWGEWEYTPLELRVVEASDHIKGRQVVVKSGRDRGSLSFRSGYLRVIGKQYEIRCFHRRNDADARSRLRSPVEIELSTGEKLVVECSKNEYEVLRSLADSVPEIVTI